MDTDNELDISLFDVTPDEPTTPNKVVDTFVTQPVPITAVLPINYIESGNPLTRLATEVGSTIPTDKLHVIDRFMERAKYGHQASLPLICKGKACHPEGTKIKTFNGYKNIENLNPNDDTIISWDRNNNAIRGGNNSAYKFTLHERIYTGNLFTVTDGINSYQCTHDHIVTVRWTEDAENLFAVYLMNKGNFWRVGKVKLFTGGTAKTIFGPLNRARTEQADKVWILGVYKTNTEALLAEEYISCKYGISKSCFIATRDRKKTKYNGLYKWVTQEQLNNHHKSIAKNFLFYKNMLESLNLDINYPFLDLSILYPGNRILEINACNIISGYMECPTEETVPYERYKKNGKKIIGCYKAIWKRIYTSSNITNNIKVYSLGVEPYKHYIANGLVTHNCPFLSMCVLHQVGAELPYGKTCPIEGALIEQWVKKTIIALGIDPNSSEYAVDMDMVYELAGMELIRMRAGYHLSMDGSLVEEKIVGYSPQGDPIYDEKPRVSLLVLEKYSKVISKLREQLLATRKAQAQAGQIASDPSIRTANIMARAKAIIEKRQASVKDSKNEPVDAQYKLKDE